MAGILSRRKAQIYDAALKRHDWPYPLPLELRKLLERQVLEECGFPPGTTEGEIERNAEWIEDYVSMLKRRINLHQDAVLISLPMPSTNKRRTIPSTEWHRALFERRFNIVRFVIESKHSERVRWQEMSDAWSKSHPRDRLGPSQMKTLYKRARKDDGIMVQIMVMDGSEAMRVLSNPHDLESWKGDKQRGIRHIRVIKVNLRKPGTGLEEADNER